jgi:hypothetical protein
VRRRHGRAAGGAAADPGRDAGRGGRRAAGPRVGRIGAGLLNRFTRPPPRVQVAGAACGGWCLTDSHASPVHARLLRREL